MVALVVRGSSRRPIETIVGWVLIVGIALSLSFDLEVDSNVSAFLETTSQEWGNYEYLEAVFGGDGFLTVVFPHDRSDEGPAIWGVGELTRVLSTLDIVESVESLASYKRLRRTGRFEITSAPLLSNGVLCEGCIEVAIQDPYLVNSGLVARDGTAVGVVARLRSGDPARRAEAIEIAQETAFRAMPEAMVSGVPLFRDVILKRTVGELRSTAPLALFLVAVIVLIAFRSLLPVWCGLCCGVIPVSIVVAVMSVGSIPLSLTTFTLPAILLALGMAYSVHLVVVGAGRGSEPLEVTDTAVMIVLSAVTTAAGFLAMSAVGVPAIRDFAVLGSLGVLAIAAVVTSFVPAVLSLSRTHVGGRTLETVGALTSWCADSSRRRVRMVLVVWGCLVAVGMVGIARLKLESDIVQWFPNGDLVRDDYEAIRSKISGITPLSFVIQGGSEAGVAGASAASTISMFLQHLREEEIVGGAVGYTDLVKVAGEALGGSRREVFRDDSTIAQLLLMLRADASLERLITLDGQVGLVAARVDGNGSKEILGLAHRAEKWWKENAMVGLSLTATGIMYEYARAQEQISESQMRGLGAAVMMIAAILFISCRNRSVLLAVLVSSGSPIIVLYGAFGLMGIPIDAATVSIAAVALGIAVDDSVHLASCYGGFGGLGVAPQRWSFIAPILVVTTAVICAGFGALSTSGFEIVSRLGLVTASTVALCLLSDLTLLPALLGPAQGRN